MNKKHLVALSLIAVKAIAMELTIDNKQARHTDTAEQMVVIPIQDQERKIPARFIPIIGALAGFYVEDTPLQMSPITMVSLDTWQLIENQLERVYAINQDNQQVRNDIIADYSQLDSTSFSDLIKVVDYLDIALLKEITFELAQNKLTLDEILELPEYVRNEVIKRKALSIAGPVLLKKIAALPLSDCHVREVCVTHDNKIVLCSSDGTVRIGDMDGNQLAVCQGHEQAVSSVCVTKDNRIVSGSWDGTVRIWDMAGNQLAVRRGVFVNSVCVTPDNKIVLGSGDTTLRIWDTDGKQLAVCRGHSLAVTSVCVTKDNKIVSGSQDRTVRIWDMNGEELAVCRGHESEVNSVCVTQDNKIVSGSHGGTVRIWNMNGRPLAVCMGHEGKVTSVCVTHDNKIVSGSYDNTVRIWDMNGKELAVCRGEVRGRHKDQFCSVCITQDNKIVSSFFDIRVQIWDRSDITLNGRLSDMSYSQAEAICAILRSATCENKKQKERCWKKITKVLEDIALGIQIKKKRKESVRKHYPGKRLRKSPKEEENSYRK